MSPFLPDFSICQVGYISVWGTKCSLCSGFDENLAKMCQVLTVMLGVVARTIHVLPISSSSQPCTLVLLSIIVPVILYWDLSDVGERKLRQELWSSLPTVARPAGDSGRTATQTG